MGLSQRLQRAEGRTRPAPAGLDRRTLLRITRAAVLLRERLRAGGRIHLGEWAAAVRADCGAGPEIVEGSVAVEVWSGHARVEGDYLVPAADEPYVSQLLDVLSVWGARFRGRVRVRRGEFADACRADRGAGPQAVQQYVALKVRVGSARIEGDYLVPTE